MFKTYEERGLPGFLIGYEANRENQYIESEVFKGPFRAEKKSDSSYTTYQVKIVCNGLQTRIFTDFLYTVVSTYSGYFLKDMETINGNNEQLVRIISGIPSPVQMAHDTWSYSFTIGVDSLNEEFKDLPDDITTLFPPGYKYSPKIWYPMVSNLNIQGQQYSPLDISVSSDGLTLVSCLGGGSTTRSVDGGTTWRAFPDYLSVDKQGNAVLSSISGDGLFMVFAFNHDPVVVSEPDGLRLSYSKDGGRTFKTFIVPISYSSFAEFSTLKVTDGGRVFVGTKSGQIFASFDYLLTMNEYKPDEDPAEKTNILAMTTNAAGTVMFYSDKTGNVYYLNTNNEATFLNSTKVSITNEGVGDCRGLASSSDGNIIYYSKSEKVGGTEYGFVGRVTNATSTTPVVNELQRGLVFSDDEGVFYHTYSIACSPDASIVLFGMEEGRACVSSDYGDTFSKIENSYSSGGQNLDTIKVVGNGYFWFSIMEDNKASYSKPRFISTKPPEPIVPKVPQTWVPLSNNNFGLDSTIQPYGSAMSFDGNYIYVVMNSGYGARSSNSGASFNSMSRYFNSGLLFANVLCVDCSRDGRIVIVGGTNGLVSINKNYGLGDFTPLNASNPDGDNNTEDAVRIALPAPYNQDVYACAISADGNYIYLAIEGGIVMSSSDGGESFSSSVIPGGTSIDVLSICCSQDGGFVFYGGEDGACGYSYDYANSFSAYITSMGASGTNRDIVDVDCSVDGMFVYFAMQAQGVGIAENSYDDDDGFSYLARNISRASLGDVTSDTSTFDPTSISCSDVGNIVLTTNNGGICIGSDDYMNQNSLEQSGARYLNSGQTSGSRSSTLSFTGYKAFVPFQGGKQSIGT